MEVPLKIAGYIAKGNENGMPKGWPHSDEFAGLLTITKICI